MHPTLRLPLVAFATAAALCQLGCVTLRKAYPERSHYRLSIPPASPAAGPAAEQPAGPTNSPAVLRVAPFTASDAFRGVEFIYRTGAHTWETDFYNVFLVSPAAQVAEEVRARLAGGHLFPRVVGPDSAAEPTHVLQGHLQALYGDFTDRRDPKAVVRMELSVLEVGQGSPRIVLLEAYESVKQADVPGGGDERRGEALVAAWDAALADILGRFEDAVRRTPALRRK
jgi:hypothetical protein